MSFAPPRSLSPSKIAAFGKCALAFRFTAVERLPEAPTVWTVRGTLVHRALEQLFWHHPRGSRSQEIALFELAGAWDTLQDDPEYAALGLSLEEAEAFRAEAEGLVRNYFLIEDPDSVEAVGVELMLEVGWGELRLRGIIDRLDLTPQGELVVIDYKTGRAPSAAYEQARLAGVQIYALLCAEVLGRLPVEVRLVHLKEPTVVAARPSEQTVRGQRQRALAVWSAVEQACDREDFRPRTSPLCRFCNFQAFCPAFGGDPDEAARAMGHSGPSPVGLQARRSPR